MKQKIAQIMFMLALLVAPQFAQPATASAACPSTNTSEGQIAQGIGETGTACDDAKVESTVKAVVSILSYVTGVAAIIMIIIAGFKYVASNGDAGKIGGAKTTLIYALVGVAIAAMAQVLVLFVLDYTE